VPRTVFIIGAVALLICGLWWGSFYLDVLRAAGRLETSKSATEGIKLYGSCLFWDDAHCLAAKADPKFAGHVHYQPFVIWLVLGLLLGGAIIRVQQAIRETVKARS
jgi:hypothetical protein